MSDLRERMITALHNADCACSDTPTHFAAQYTPQADAALAEVASWRREQINTAGSQYRASAELERLAAEISPTHDEGQTP
jgi:hypothetical protein